MSKNVDPKDKFIRESIAFLTSKAKFHSRGDRVYVDTRKMQGTKLLNIEGPEFRSFLMRLAKSKVNVLMRGSDAELIVEHALFHAQEVAKPLSSDARSMFKDEKLYINPGWENGNLITIDDEGSWTEEAQEEWMFEPMTPKMRMVVPQKREATMFPEYLKQGIADFKDHHCLLAVTCATMLLPSDFVHPFIVFTGDQARGKSTTMKLMLQLVDPYDKGELMSVGEDMRDIIALCRGRHSIALDNVSKLPFDEDLLSKMYSGGLFATRKMMTNSEVSEVETPRLRVLMNGIGNAFTRSDLMSRCIFIDHPVLTTIKPDGTEDFAPLSVVENRWKKMLPEALGSLLSALGSGMGIFKKKGGLEGKTSHSRFVEYCVIGECIAEAMGFESGLFTKQVDLASEQQKAGAIDADDCAQLVIAWLNGERATNTTDAFAEQLPLAASSEYILSPADFFGEIRGLAAHRGYSVYSLKWLASTKAFSAALTRSQKNIEHGGWAMLKLTGGDHNRKIKFTKK